MSMFRDRDAGGTDAAAPRDAAPAARPGFGFGGGRFGWSERGGGESGAWPAPGPSRQGSTVAGGIAGEGTIAPASRLADAPPMRSVARPHVDRAAADVPRAPAEAGPEATMPPSAATGPAVSEAAAQAARAALRPEGPAGNRPASGQPSAATVSDALARHGDETFAARARLAALQAGPPRRPRIWEMDEGGAAGAQRPASARAESRGGRGDWLDRIGTPGEGEGGSAALRAGQSSEADPGARLPEPLPEPRDDAGGADRPATDAALPASRRPAPFVLGRRPDPAAPAGMPVADGGGAPPKDLADDRAGAPGGDAEDAVAYARAQLARMAELGLADDAADDAESTPGGGRSARAKTRVLGFRPPEADDDPLARAGAACAGRGPDFPVGWLVVVEGAGRGASFALTSGVATLGRGEDQTVRLDFGDTAISRQGHASIVFDDETGRFYLGAGSRTNLVRRNGRPVLATEEVAGGDEIRLGETTLRLVALCGDGFSWSEGVADSGVAGGGVTGGSVTGGGVAGGGVAGGGVTGGA